VSEEYFDAGRKIGLVARKNRELYETVKQIAKRKGMKMQDVLEEALNIWRLYQTLENVDPKALVSAIAFIEHMLNYSVSLLVRLGQAFTSEFVRSTMGIATELSTIQTQVAQQQQAQTQQQAQQNIVSELKEQMRISIMQSIIPMLMSIIQQIMTIYFGGKAVALPTQQLPLLSQTTSKPIKIEA
jgi:hypothetical protein